MGMSASQANLLSITARMHNIEYKAQAIESAKIELATQKDELYQKYNDALDAKRIQVAFKSDGITYNYVDATFTSVCGYNSTRKQQYALRDADTGRVIVDQDVYDMYTSGFDSDKYSFAWAMVGLENSFSWNLDDGSYGGREGAAVGINHDDRGDDTYSGQKTTLLMTDVEEMVFENVKDTDTTLQGYYDKYQEAQESGDASEIASTFKTFRDELYSKHGSEIYKYMVLDKTDPENTDPENGSVNLDFKGKSWDDVENEFNFYVHLFEEIQNAGGCVSISKYTEDGDTGNDWFNNMINSGRILIDMYDEKTKGWTETSVATSTTENYLQEVSDDTDVKKAEAEYEYELGLINNKDKKFDTQLSKLETERNSLKTEMDAIKQVKDDNIDRTFGIFS